MVCRNRTVLAPTANRINDVMSAVNHIERETTNHTKLSSRIEGRDLFRVIRRFLSACGDTQAGSQPP